MGKTETFMERKGYGCGQDLAYIFRNIKKADYLPKRAC